MNEIPLWLLEARESIEENMKTAGGVYSQQPTVHNDAWDVGYWDGYWDACRHALKALPPFLKYPDAEDWREEGFVPPGESA